MRSLPPLAPPEHGATGRVDAVNLEDRLSEVEPDRDDGHGKLPSGCGRATRSHVRVSDGAVHAIKRATTRRYMTLEKLGTVSDTAVVSLPAMAV